MEVIGKFRGQDVKTEAQMENAWNTLMVKGEEKDTMHSVWNSVTAKSVGGPLFPTGRENSWVDPNYTRDLNRTSDPDATKWSGIKYGLVIAVVSAVSLVGSLGIGLLATRRWTILKLTGGALLADGLLTLGDLYTSAQERERLGTLRRTRIEEHTLLIREIAKSKLHKLDLADKLKKAGLAEGEGDTLIANKSFAQLAMDLNTMSSDLALGEFHEEIVADVRGQKG